MDGIPAKKKTCMQCRNRKVRCDGLLDGCSNCARLGFDCSFRSVNGDALQSTHHPTPKRPRVSRACQACRTIKSRCSGHWPTCQRCEAKGNACVYRQRQSRHSQQQGSSEPDTHHPRTPFLDDFTDPLMSIQHFTSSLPEPERIRLAILSFFSHFHCLPSLAFLHKASLLRLHSEGQADQALLACIIAVTSLLPESSLGDREIGSQCAEMAENLILNDFRRPSVFKLQALVLLVRFRIWTGSPDHALLLMAQLSRSAFALRINYETSKPSFFIQESRRRLMWAIYILDSVLSCGLQEYTSCPINVMHIRLPCAEDDFELNNETNIEYIRQGEAGAVRLGILAYYVRIVSIHDEINRYTRQASHPKVDFRTLASESQSLEKSLEIFTSKLPEGERYSQRNLKLRAFSPRLPRFIMTHIWWHHCYCQLFRGMISSSPPLIPEAYLEHLGATTVLENQAKCLSHADAIGTIFSSLLAVEGDSWTLEYEMAECAHTAVEILLACDTTVYEKVGLAKRQALDYMTACLQLTERLQQMYPAVSAMTACIERNLHAFTRGIPVHPKPSTMREIAPHQIIPKLSVLGRTNFIDDSHKLEMPFALKPQAPCSTADPPHGPGQVLNTPPMNGPEAYGEIMVPQNAIFWDPEHQHSFQDLESVSNIWDPLSLLENSFEDIGAATENV